MSNRLQALFHDAKVRRGLLFGTLPLALVAVILALIYLYHEASARNDVIALQSRLNGDSGPDFILEGQPVHIVFEVEPLRAKLGDSVAIRMGLRRLALPKGYDISGLANETNGSFSPVLSVPAECGTPPKGRTFPTKTPAQYLIWHWTVGCSTAGDKEFEITLDYDGAQLMVPPDLDPASIGSASAPAPTAFRKQFAITYYRPMLELLGGFASAVFLALISPIVVYFLPKRDGQTKDPAKPST